MKNRRRNSIGLFETFLSIVAGQNVVTTSVKSFPFPPFTFWTRRSRCDTRGERNKIHSSPPRLTHASRLRLIGLSIYFKRRNSSTSNWLVSLPVCVCVRLWLWQRVQNQAVCRSIFQFAQKKNEGRKQNVSRLFPATQTKHLFPVGQPAPAKQLQRHSLIEICRFYHTENHNIYICI